MNLGNFEKYIADKIVKRGYSYYLNGHVDDILDNGANDYKIIVRGSDRYVVGVSLNDVHKIVGYSCNCPYDHGDICKHIVAAFCHLKDELIHDRDLDDIEEAEVVDDFESYQSNKMRSASNPYGQIRHNLNQRSKEELVNIILSYSRKKRGVMYGFLRELGIGL